MGRSLTLASFFNGYGFIMIGVLLLISILLWLLSSAPVRSMILLLGLFLVFMAIMEFIYFFAFAAAFSLLAGISTLFAYQKSKAL
jgi:divalent metal cation (Fe/Co/Zn/Cd) transporter